MILQRSHQAIQIIHRVKLQWNTFILYTLITNEKRSLRTNAISSLKRDLTRIQNRVQNSFTKNSFL